jgi:manganese/zinc/iron transport system ATP- binding protein
LAAKRLSAVCKIAYRQAVEDYFMHLPHHNMSKLPKLAALHGARQNELGDSKAPLFVKGLSVAYGAKPVVFSVDAAFRASALTAIIGPNGAGKSTLLKGALSIVPVMSGHIRFFGKSFAAMRKHIAYVPQRVSVDWDFPARVVDVVMMGLYHEMGLMGRIKAEHHKRVHLCLERVGMASFASRQIGQLSGGQQQRVFLARALAQNPDLFLFDEPFAGVDAATEATIIDVLHDLRDQGKTIICVHHDLATVKHYFDDVLLMNRHKIAHGSVETTFTLDYLQATYEGRLANTHIDQLKMQDG